MRTGQNRQCWSAFWQHAEWQCCLHEMQKPKLLVGHIYRKTGGHHTKLHCSIAGNSEPPLQNRPVMCGERGYQQLRSKLVLHGHFADWPLTVWEGEGSADAYNSRKHCRVQQSGRQRHEIDQHRQKRLWPARASRSASKSARFSSNQRRCFQLKSL